MDSEDWTETSLGAQVISVVFSCSGPFRKPASVYEVLGVAFFFQSPILCQHMILDSLCISSLER